MGKVQRQRQDGCPSENGRVLAMTDFYAVVTPGMWAEVSGRSGEIAIPYRPCPAGPYFGRCVIIQETIGM